jgi:membrane protease YdiL (CAAX protease family)
MSRSLEPAEVGYGDWVFMTALLVIGLVLVALYERGGRGCARERVLFSPWGAEDVLLAVAAFFLGLLLLGTLARLFRSAQTQVWVPSMVISLAEILACLVVFFDLSRRYGLGPVDLGLRFERWGHDLFLAAGMLVFVLGLRLPMSGLVHYLYERAGEPFERQFVIQQMLDVRSTWGLRVMVVVAVGAAPVCEEIAFRGFLQPYLRHRMGAAGSIVATAVLFSLIHDPRSKFLAVPFFVFPLALALGYCYERTQRLAAPILLHVLHNLISVVAVLTVRAMS